jgi:sulfate permease, SulP family
MSVAQPPDIAWSRRLAAELQPWRLLQTLNAALMLYLLTAILTLSIAALVWAGPLAVHLPQALGGVLLGTALLVAMVSGLGSWGGAIAPAEDAPGIIVALGAAAAASALAAADPGMRFATVAVLVAGTTIAMGLVYLLVRAFRLEALARFMPHPVMGGFLAGTGWLLVVGGIGLATGVPPGRGWFQGDTPARWVPAFALGLLMLLVVHRRRSAAPLAALLALAFVSFHAVMALLGRTPRDIEAGGWLLGPFPDELSWRFPLAPGVLAEVDWGAIAIAAPVAAPALLIGTIALLLNTSALELVIKRDIALDRELLAHGAGNVLSGLAGGNIGYTAISLSALNHALGGGRRGPGLLVSALLMATAAFGTSLVSSTPRLVMGGLVIFIGLGLLHEWIVRARHTLTRAEYAIVLVIFAVIAIENFLLGVAVGLVATTLLFVVSYARIVPVRFELSGEAVRSRVVRGSRDRQRLKEQAGRLLLLRLHGYLFFGTANGLLDRVRLRLAAGAARRCVLLDFEQVAGIDSTALISFGRLAQQAAEEGVELILTGLPPRVADLLRRDPELARLRCFADLDHGIEWCEERLLEEDGGAPPAGTALREELLALLPDAARIDALLAHTTRLELRAGEHLMHEGDEPDALYFVESGQLSAQIPRGDGREGVRLQTMHAGSMVGELGLLLGGPRSADVVADRDSALRVIDREEWRRIIEREPDVARTIDALALRLLGERVMHLTRVVDALQR